MKGSDVLGHVRAFAVTVLALLALGAGAGLAWSWLAPRTVYAVTSAGTLIADPSTQTLIAADGWFALLTGGLGLLCGLAAWWAGRRHALQMVAGLCVGGALAAFLALWIGSTFTLGTATVAAAPQPGIEFFAGPLQLTATGVLVAWPLLAVGLFALLEGVVAYRDSPLRKPYGSIPGE